MVINRTCKATNEKGQPCGAAPLLDGDFCFWHDPEHQADVAEARRVGGARRRREGTLVTAFEVGNLDSIPDLRRLLLIAVVDTLGLENSIARSRTLGYLTQVGVGLLEKGELTSRMEAIEAALGPRLVKTEPRKHNWWGR